ncbi:hypothetical protein [Streptosporangium sp. NPDC003464]
MTSTTGGLDRFISGLFDGRLLRPAQTAELFAVPKGADGKALPYADDSICSTGPDKGTACFSVGLMSVPLTDDSATRRWGAHTTLRHRVLISKVGCKGHTISYSGE